MNARDMLSEAPQMRERLQSRTAPQMRERLQSALRARFDGAGRPPRPSSLVRGGSESGRRERDGRAGAGGLAPPGSLLLRRLRAPGMTPFFAGSPPAPPRAPPAP